MKYFRCFSIALVCLGILGGGCSKDKPPAGKPSAEKPSGSDKKLAKQPAPSESLQKVLADINGKEQQWLGVYVQGNKIGFANMEAVDNRDSTPSVVEVGMAMEMETKVLGEVVKMAMSFRQVFDARPPYRLLSSQDEMRQKDEVQRVEVSRLGDGPDYSAKVTQGGVSQTRKFSVDYTLLDFFSDDLWLKKSPNVGEENAGKNLDMERFRMMASKSRIKAKKKRMHNGVPVTYYVIETTDEDGLQMDALILADGTPVKMTVGGLFELRLEPEKVAKALGAPRELFVDNLVRAEGKIGDPSKVKRMIVDVDEQFGKHLGNAPGQRVAPRLADGMFRVAITSDNASDIRVTEEERKRALEATVEYPIREAKIVALAKQAVGEAKSPREKVAALVKFVDKFVEDNYSAEPLTVMDVIRRQVGDCTEHSELFTTLARASGIPARTVSGLIYGEDDEEGKCLFGGHAWNEVEIDGFWVPVDATWNEIVINATHIRFPVKINQEMQVYANLPKARMKVVEVSTKANEEQD